MEMSYNGKYYCLDNLADHFGDFVLDGKWIADDDGIYHLTDEEGKGYELAETFKDGILHYDGLGETLIRLNKAYGQIEEKTATLETTLNGNKPWEGWDYSFLDSFTLDKELTGGNAFDTELRVSDMANAAEELVEEIDRLIKEIDEDCANGKVIEHVEEGDGFDAIVADVVEGKLHTYMRGWGGARTMFAYKDPHHENLYGDGKGIRAIS